MTALSDTSPILPADFRLLRNIPIPGLRGIAREIEHVSTGAKILHVSADDCENLFSISFPTVPPDATGLPHILEHSVLAGSRRFPVREPFFEMLKMSMATFINAMTGQDCTYYPVSSTVRQDLFNLADVYFDAVFHPLLTEETFRREGHHFAPASRDNPLGPLAISGIVYNEMKGAYSSPETRLFFTWVKALLPDTIYARNSAGDPAAIPDLTYADFKRFYETHYHPSNAFFILYGDIPTEDYLAFLAPRLAAFDRREARFDVPRQSRWSKPRATHDTYPASAAEALEGKTYLTLHWIIGHAFDPEESVLRNVFSYVLLGNEAAPLKKALIDSRLGQDLVHSGVMDIGQEALFAVGLKGSDPDKAAAFESLVLAELKRLAAAPIERELIEAAFRQAAYEYLEIGSMFPVDVMGRLLGPWIFRVDPLRFADMAPHLTAARRRYANDPGIFNRMIRECLLDNPHRLLAVLRPDRDCEARAEAAIAERLRTVRAGLSDAEAASIARDAESMERAAGTPNTPESIALLPQLKLRDMPSRPRHIATSVSRIDHGPVLLRNDLFTKGVNYLSFNFDLHNLPSDLWVDLPRYCEALAKMGAAGMTYEHIARRTASYTGGIGASCMFHVPVSGGAAPVWGLRVSCKALDEQMEGALSLLSDVLFAVDPRDPRRLADLLGQSRAGYRAAVLESGQHLARLRAARGMNEESFLDDVNHGLPQLPIVARLCDGGDSALGDAMTRIERIRDFLHSNPRITVSFTGSDRAWDLLLAAIRQWMLRIKAVPAVPSTTGFRASTTSAREGLLAPIQVAHCVRVLQAQAFDHPDSCALAVGGRLVTFDYMLPEVRLKGNAYGAGCSYSPLSGLLTLSSFRDPHVVRTLGIFEGVREFVSSAGWTAEDVNRAIIGVAKDAERPLRPAEATGEALFRHLAGLTPDVREKRYAALLAVEPKAVRRSLLDAFDAGAARAATCVIAGRDKIEDANTQMAGMPLALTEVPL